MDCPNCKSSLRKNNMEIIAVEKDHVEIEVRCEECAAEYFTRIQVDDLILID